MAWAGKMLFLRVEKKNQLDATEWFISLIICSTCFGHFYAHHQELETIRALLTPMVCSAWLLAVGGQMQESRLCVRDEGCCSTELSNIPYPERIAGCSVPDLQQPATKTSHTIGGNNTHVVSSSWWCALKCPKHVEHIISAMNHSVAPNWFFFCTHINGYIKSSSQITISILYVAILYYITLDRIYVTNL